MMIDGIEDCGTKVKAMIIIKINRGNVTKTTNARLFASGMTGENGVTAIQIVNKDYD